MRKNRKSPLLTTVERKTLYTAIFRLAGKHADILTKAAIKKMKKLKDRIKTITFDNGLVFSAYEEITPP